MNELKMVGAGKGEAHRRVGFKHYGLTSECIYKMGDHAGS